MKNPLLTIVMFLVFVINAFSQVEDKTITQKDKLYYQDGQIKTRAEIISILEHNPASASEYHKYTVTRNAGLLITSSGALIALIGGIVYVGSAVDHEVNHWFGDQSPEPKGAGVSLAGAGIMVVGVVILAGNPHFNKSINLYNSSVKNIGSKPVRFDLTLNPNGLGMKMTF